LNTEAAINFVLKMLESSLPKNLSYHSYSHTVAVMSKAEEIMKSCALTPYEQSLVRSAGALHDVGFLVNPANHEEEGCKIARDILPKFGFDDRNIKVICDMIMATRIPQSAKTLSERILCDADLFYLGGDDYSKIADSLRQEWMNLGSPMTDDQWLEVQIDFIGKHQYYTDFCRKMLTSKKQLNYQSLIADRERLNTQK